MRNSTRIGGRWTAVAVVALTITALAACSGGGGGGTTPTAAADFDPEGKITVGVRLLSPSWDPSKSPGATTSPIDQLVYDTLIDVDANLELVPELALSWVTEDDGLTWNFELREGVTFSDGSAFDAEDVKASVDYYLAEGSNLRASLQGLSSVEVVDEYNVKFVLSSPNVEFPSVMANPVGTVLSSDVVAAVDFASPVGTGKFILEDSTPGVELVFAANPDHWNPDSVKLAGATVRAIEDPVAMANAMRSGEIDMAILEPSQAASVESAGIPTYEIGGAQLVAMGLNPDLAPELADPRVRMALAMAVDRQGSIDGLFFGRGDTANQFIAPGRFGFNPDLEEIPYDIEGARELLEEAGYGDGFAYTAAIQANNRQLAEALQASWAEIGVDVELTFPPGAGVSEAAWINPTVPLATANLVPGFDTASFLARNLSPEALRNPGGIDVPGVMDLIREAQVTPDEGEREEVYQEIAELTRETIPAYFPIIWRSYTIAYSDELVGMQEWQAGYPILDGVGVKK